MAKANILIGTSGFSYKEWLGGFYPEKLPGAKMLEYYAERMPTVEINYTFRAMPKSAMLEGWAARTPANFRFALKAPQRITHFAKLRDVKETTDTFIERASVMGERLAPALFQLPPDLKLDLPLLKDFLAILKGRIRAAFEFRNKSWFDESVMTALADNGAALCIAETEKLASPLERTAPYIYVRLRKETYDDAGLDQWVKNLDRLAQNATEIFVYFKHETPPPISRRACARSSNVPPSASREQTLAGHVIDLEPDAVGILEQHRVISRRPRTLLRRMHDLRADRFEEKINLIDVAMLARAQTHMMQPDAALLEFLRAIRVVAAHDSHRGPVRPRSTEAPRCASQA